MARVTTKGLARSSGFGLGAELWRILSRLFLTPLIITKLGLAGYGTWTVLFSITAQLGIVNASFGVAYAKLTAEYDSRGDYKTLTSILSSGMVLVLSFAVVALTTIWFARVPLLDLVKVPEESIDDAATALMIVTSVVLIQLSAGSVTRALEGLQRLDLVYALRILASFIDFCVTMTLLIMGYGLKGLAIGFAVGQLTALVFARYFCHRVEPRIGITPFRPSREGFSKIARLGGKFQLLAVMGTLINQGGKLVVSALLGVSMLAIFEIADKLIKLGGTVGRSIVGPLLPAFANLHAQGGYAQRMRDLYTQASRVLAVTTALCFTFLVVFADDVIVLWTGDPYPLSAWTLRVFTVAAFFQTLTGVGTASLRARGMIRLELSTVVLAAFIVFGSMWPLSQKFGYHGVVIAFLLGGLIGPPWFLSWYHKFEGFSGWLYTKTVILRPLLALAPSVFICWLLSHYVGLPVVHSNLRVQALIELLVWGSLFAIMASGAAWFFVLEPDERAALIRRVGPRVRTNE
jgi:O-antigen/teichoic acid export membrane protein